MKDKGSARKERYLLTGTFPFHTVTPPRTSPASNGGQGLLAPAQRKRAPRENRILIPGCTLPKGERWAS